MIITYKPGQKGFSTPMLRIANRKLSQASCLSIGDEISVTYLPGQIVITKINNNQNYVQEEIKQVPNQKQGDSNRSGLVGTAKR